MHFFALSGFDPFVYSWGIKSFHQIPILPAVVGDVDAGQAFVLRISSVSGLSLAVIAWLVRNAEASKTRDALVLGYTLLFALWALVSLHGQFILPAPDNQGSWVQAVIQGLIAVGFFMAGRRSMSTKAS
jgi:hypothetical protein